MQAQALWRRLFSSGETPKHGWGKFYPKGKPPRRAEGTAKAAAKGARLRAAGRGVLCCFRSVPPLCICARLPSFLLLSAALPSQIRLGQQLNDICYILAFI